MSELTKDLSELVRRYNGTFAIVTHPGASFIRTYHATIQQNAEDAKRLRALEMAMVEYVEKYPYGWAYSAIRWVTKRANEILLEGEPHDQD